MIASTIGTTKPSFSARILLVCAMAAAGTTATFAQNVGSWLNGGSPGNFLVCSNNFGLTSPQFIAAMTSGGHVLTYWTPAVGSPMTAAGFAAFDGVFLAGPVLGAGANIAAELIAYVQGGGGVYVAMGTGLLPGFSGSSANEAHYWNPILSPFGLAISATFNGLGAVYSCAFPHPIFAGVSALDFNNGNTVSALGASPNVTTFGNAAQPGGASGTIEFASNMVDTPWDLFLTFSSPVVGLGAGGILLGDGQIVNLSIFTPGLFISFNGFQGGVFPGPFSFPYAFPPGSGAFSGQMVLLDSSTSSGVRLSAPFRIEP